MTSSKKRFIAGATCPKCNAMDSIVMYRDDDKDHRECVACGFSDVMHFKPGVRELSTRVNVSAEDKHIETEPVKILDLPIGKQKDS